MRWVPGNAVRTHTGHTVWVSWEGFSGKWPSSGQASPVPVATTATGPRGAGGEGRKGLISPAGGRRD